MSLQSDLLLKFDHTVILDFTIQLGALFAMNYHCEGKGASLIELRLKTDLTSHEFNKLLADAET